MREIRFNVYKFEELSETSKKKAIENYREEYDGYLFDSEDLKSNLEYYLSDMGYEDKEVFFSLSYSQGDGVRFEGDLSQDELLELGKRLLTSQEFELLESLKEKDYNFRGKIKGTSHMYYHYNTMAVTLESDLDYLDQDEYDVLWGDDLFVTYTELLERLEGLIQLDVVTQSKEMEKMGYEAIEYRNSDEYISEILIGNDTIEYLEDGTMW